MPTNSNLPTLLAEAAQLGAVVSKLAAVQAMMQANRPGKTFAKRAALYLEAADQLEKLHQLTGRVSLPGKRAKRTLPTPVPATGRPITVEEVESAAS